VISTPQQERLMTLSIEEFLRRFLLHVLPRRLRPHPHFGILSTRQPLALLRCAAADRSRPLRQRADDREESPSNWRPLACPMRRPMLVLERLQRRNCGFGRRRRTTSWQPYENAALSIDKSPSPTPAAPCVSLPIRAQLSCPTFRASHLPAKNGLLQQTRRAYGAD